MSSFGFAIFMFGLFNLFGGVFLGSFFTFRNLTQNTEAGAGEDDRPHP